ncbi:MAG: beta strand repeat-containing protein, partial [Gammaproteobacteria bacterium]
TSQGTYIFAGNNVIQTADHSGNLNTYQAVTLTLNTGTITLNSAIANDSSLAASGNGIYITAGGNGTSSITFYGTIAQINAALNHAIYNKVNGYADQLTIAVHDVNSTNTVNASPIVFGSVSIYSSPTIVAGLSNVSVNTYVEGGNPILVNPNMIMGDVVRNTTGNQFGSYTSYTGDSISVSRVGGANPNDVFGLNLTTLNNSVNAYLSGNSIYYNGQNIGNYSCTNGILNVKFLNTSYVTGNAVSQVLQSITYQNNNSSPPNSVQLQYTINDGMIANDIFTGYTTVNISPVNTTPVININSSIDVNLNANLIIGNKLSISDDNNKYIVTLKVDRGFLDLIGDNSGATIVGGSNGSASISLQGNSSQLNNALAKLMYIPAANYIGTANLNIIVNEQGSLNPLTSTQNSIINIVGTFNHGDVPLITAPITMNSNSILGGSNSIVIDNANHDNPLSIISLNVQNGTISLNSTANLQIISGNNNTNSITLSGKISDINTALNNLTYNSSNYKADQLSIITTNVLDGSMASKVVNIPLSTSGINFLDPISANIYKVGSSAATIDNNVSFYSKVNDANNSYTGSMITISRVGTPDPGDIFSINIAGIQSNIINSNNWYSTGYTNGILTSGRMLLNPSGVNSGSLYFNLNNGVATFSLTADWGSGPQTANLLNAILRNVQYSSSATNLPSNIQLQYVFNDGHGNIATSNIAQNIITSYNQAPLLTAPSSITLTANNAFN